VLPFLQEEELKIADTLISTSVIVKMLLDKVECMSSYFGVIVDGYCLALSRWSVLLATNEQGLALLGNSMFVKPGTEAKFIDKS
jgi:hypothetical protein